VTTSLSASRVGVSTKVSPTSCNTPPAAKLASGWRDRGVVRAVAVDEVARMLQGCDRRIGTGRRDVAILTVLARLGSRRDEVAALSVDDINWHTGELVVTGKGSRREWLRVDVGEAIAVHCRAVAATGAGAPCS